VRGVPCPWRWAVTPPLGASRGDIKTVERIVRGGSVRGLGRKTARARFEWGFGRGDGFMGRNLPRGGWHRLSVALRPSL
jgi:hypothetical protein